MEIPKAPALFLLAGFAGPLPLPSPAGSGCSRCQVARQIKAVALGGQAGTELLSWGSAAAREEPLLLQLLRQNGAADAGAEGQG